MTPEVWFGLDMAEVFIKTLKFFFVKATIEISAHAVLERPWIIYKVRFP